MQKKERKCGRPTMFDDNQRRFIFEQLAAGRSAWDIAKDWQGEVIEQNISYYKKKYQRDLIMIEWMFNIGSMD